MKQNLAQKKLDHRGLLEVKCQSTVGPRLSDSDASSKEGEGDAGSVPSCKANKKIKKNRARTEEQQRSKSAAQKAISCFDNEVFSAPIPYSVVRHVTNANGFKPATAIPREDCIRSQKKCTWSVSTSRLPWTCREKKEREMERENQG